jgi:hypothetical protein
MFALDGDPGSVVLSACVLPEHKGRQQAFVALANGDLCSYSSGGMYWALAKGAPLMQLALCGPALLARTDAGEVLSSDCSGGVPTGTASVAVPRAARIAGGGRHAGTCPPR